MSSASPVPVPKSTRAARFLFGESAESSSAIDIAIVLLLMAFLFSAALSIAAMNIAYAAAAFLWVGRMVYNRKSTIRRTPFDWLFLAFVVSEVLSTFVSYNKEQSLLYMYRRVTLLPIVYILVGNVRSQRTLKMLLGALIGSMIFVSLWGLSGLFSHLNEFVRFERRLVEFQMYMTAGGMMMVGMILLLPFVFHPKTPRKLRLFAIASLVPIGANLLFTFTRSSWLGFLAGVAVIAVVRSKKILVPVGLAIIIVIAFSSPEMRGRMMSMFNPYHPSNISRLHMWETGVRIFKDHPILGIGDMGIEQLWPRYAPPEWESEGHLHNNFLMWLVTLGVVGCAVLTALFVKIWMVMYRIERKLRGDWFCGSLALGGLAVIAGFHINGLFEWNFGDAEIIMIVWAIVGMTLAADRLKPGEVNIG